MTKDLYKRLDLEDDASEEEIKKAFRSKSMHAHPDKAGGTEEAMKLLTEAYAILKDPRKKNEYDESGSVKDVIDPNQVAYAMIARMLGGHITEQGVNIIYCDIIADLRVKIRENIVLGFKSRRTIKSGMEGMESLRKRFSYDGGNEGDPIDSYFKMIIRNNRVALEGTEDDLRTNIIGRRLLLQHHFDFEIPIEEDEYEDEEFYTTLVGRAGRIPPHL
ncbi:MAG: DnaJ domain-containing protein [Deltaproteobacteria bacterium]|nr:DnaJ domain-containing protein [Deltaproteobacteria bacterium]